MSKSEVTDNDNSTIEMRPQDNNGEHIKLPLYWLCEGGGGGGGGRGGGGGGGGGRKLTSQRANNAGGVSVA